MYFIIISWIIWVINFQSDGYSVILIYKREKLIDTTKNGKIMKFSLCSFIKVKSDENKKILMDGIKIG